MRAKTLFLKLPEQAEGTMDVMNNRSGGDLGPLNVDWKVELRLWDMNPETSTVRCIIRRRIAQFLITRPEFHAGKHEEIHYVAGLLDDVLVARAPSQVHYMNLDTLESRVHGLINTLKNVNDTSNLAGDISFSLDGAVSQSWESHNLDMSSPDNSYRTVSTSTISGDCASASSDVVRTCVYTGSASSSLLGCGSTTSRRYLPNGHHRIVADASDAANVNAICCSENIQQPLPMVSRYSTDNGVSHVISSEGYVRCWDHHDLKNVGYNSQSSRSQMSSSRIHDEPYNDTPSFSTNNDQPVDQWSFRNACQPGIESYLRMKSASDPSISSKAEHVFHCIQPEQLQPFCQQPYPSNYEPDHLQPRQKELYSQPQHSWARNEQLVSHQPQGALNESRQVGGCNVQNMSCNQSDPLQLQQNEEYQHQLSLESRKTGGPLTQKISNGYNLVSGCIRPNMVPVKSHNVNMVAQQICEPTEVSQMNPSYSSDGSTAPGGRFQGQNGDDRYSEYNKFRLLYNHALCCTGHETKRERSDCMGMKQLLDHISCCSGTCSRKHCYKYKKLLTHYQECSDITCKLCVHDNGKLENSLQGTNRSNTIKSMVSPPAVTEPEQPPSKRIKTEELFLSPTGQNDASDVSVLVKDLIHSSLKGNTLECKELCTSLNTTAESIELDTGPSLSSSEGSPGECSMAIIGDAIVRTNTTLCLKVSASLELTDAQSEKENLQVPVEADNARLEGNHMNDATPYVHMTETMPRKLKGVSLIDSFTSENIREHISSLKLLANQSTEKEEKNQMARHEADVNTCSLCGLKDLHFEPSPRYCAACLRKISPKGVCYSITNANGGDPKALVCRGCYNKSVNNATVGNTSILRANLRKIVTYADSEDLDEWWVQCDQCKAWQHQICTLFNSIKNAAVHADHTCPNCILQAIENGEHKPLSLSAIPGAKELPTTRLSEHIEKWVSRRLEEERKDRAKLLGKDSYEVPSAEGLVVRVVSSVVKQLKVKQVFRDIFPAETYPSEFPYKSKAILLFQNIDGADVCIFGMYVQEYGSRCADPNKRRVSISYIDSVKHFQPKVSAVTGEALRTFVYHEILIGYLDYCKKRGFTSCYIWACPPDHRDDDYILYCHPKIQKMPKNEKLREWYKTMIQKATMEKIVAEYTNLYNHFFVKNTECKATITAARLPYFDNDYWPGQAEGILQTGDCSNHQKKESKAVTERVLRAFKRDTKIENPKDIMLMYQLGEKIRPSKEDFIMVHLWHVCKHCCQHILSREQWVCDLCKNFRLCEKCFLLEQNQEMKDKHPTGSSEKHSFHEVHVDYIPADTIDDDEIIQSEIFDSRLMLLGYCQSNYFQFDTLRRAKHSTMMILYYLHKQFSPALVYACIGCHNNIDTCERWHCLSCTGYDLCDCCYHKGVFPHEHELVCSADVTDHNSQQSNHGKQVRSLQELSGAPLLHASKCANPRCTYPHCRKLKGLFHHGARCQTRLNGGCVHCRKIWRILQIHATYCATTECHAPRCKDLKEHLKKQRLRADSLQLLEDARRRAGAKERMKDRIRMQRKTAALEPSD